MKKLAISTAVVITMIFLGTVALFHFNSDMKALWAEEAFVVDYEELEKDNSYMYHPLVDDLLNAGVIKSYDQLIGVISGFYNTIIIILITVISVLGIIAYFSVSSMSRREAERLVDESVRDKLEKKLSDMDYINDVLNRNESIPALVQEYMVDEEKRISDLESRILSFEYRDIMQEPKEDK